MRNGMMKFAGSIVAALLVLASPVGAKDTRPSNDDFAAAETISAMPSDWTATTRKATLEDGEVQPSCSSIKSSVWYRFAPEKSLTAIADVSATAPSVVTVFAGDSLETLTETGCKKGSSFELTFDALAGQTYFLQVGSSGERRGKVDLGLTPDTWVEQELHRFSHQVEVPRTTVDVLTIDGRPRAGDPNMYDLTIETQGKRIQRGTLTFGLVQERFNEELVTIDHTAASIETIVAYRYDSGQQRCASDGGPDGGCTVKSPIKDLKWLLEDGSSAELVITIEVRDNRGALSSQRTLVVPFAGQVLGIL